MKKWLVKCSLCLGTLLLLALSNAPSGIAADLLPPVIYSEPDGWYRVNTPMLQYLVADAESWERTAKVWEEAYNDISQRYQEYIRSTKERYEQLQSQMEKEREAARRNSRRWGLGIFGGVGVNGPTVGIGVVWRVM